ncbi:hypothetical protein DM02DRAFT_614386 [Periconia macrospinosa]|uniref:Structure-specific endonuclease subunit SLX4 n=1 Tax=Periconia macrospinosa TaxID=97972 RepID=A0A2V1DT14_9PLEO|nr:hypothetical protein DM02DRAFT_614386 [Periconia macrospinosa]
MSAKTFDILVLSSSPPASSPIDSRNAVTTSSSSRRRVISSFAFSPPPPALKDDEKRKQRVLVSGSRAAAIPETARRGFMSARCLVEEGNGEGLEGGVALDNTETEQVEEGKEKEEEKKVVKTRKKRTKKSEPVVIEDSEGLEEIVEDPKPKPKPRGRKKKEDGDAPPKRLRKKKEEEEEIPVYVASSHFGGAAAATATVTASASATAAAAAGDGDIVVAEREEDIPVAVESKAKETKVAKTRKLRVKKADKVEGESAAAPKKARVTKPKAAKAKHKSAEVVSSHFQKEAQDKAAEKAQEEVPALELPPSAQDITTDNGSIWNVPSSPNTKDSRAPKHRPPDNVHEPLELDEAVARRFQWTPPRDTKAQIAQPGSSSKENTPAVAEKSTSGFTSLLSGFSYAHAQVIPDPAASSTAESRTITKRRRVELIDVPGNQAASRQSSPEKGKAPKKKARTITDLVTEQYAPKDAETEPEPAVITSNFFSPRTATTTTKLPLNDTTNTTAAKPARKKRTSSKPSSENGETKKKTRAKSSRAAAKPAKPKLVMEKLLSPSSALLKMNKQDILFGTSSQLALDESPTIVRQIQRAMMESEQDALLFQGFSDDDSPRTKPWPRLMKIEGRRGLWNASSRDEAGDLLEKQSDVYLPEPDRTQDIPLLLDGSVDDASSPFLNIDDLPPPPAKTPIPTAEPPTIQLSSDLPTPPDTLPDEPLPAQTGNDDSFAHIDDFLQEPPPSNQNVESSFAHIDDFALPTPQVSVSLSKTMPDTYSTGSPKKRPGRPAKNAFVLSRIPASAPAPPTSTHIPRTKPPSTAGPSTPSRKERFIHIEEILDSEDDEALSPTPPRTRRLKDSPPLPLVSLSATAALDPHTAFAKPPPTRAKVSNKSKAKDSSDELPPVPILRTQSSHLQFMTIKPTLFPQITSLIRSLPPTTDPTRPSWHEKILMYDPIVLEDLTAFLNSHPQMRTYRRATQKQVKAWNKHLQSIGEEKLKDLDNGVDDVGEDGGGGEVGDEGDEEIYAIHKELETWMVQKWCEEMSICCVLREKQGRGGVRKGLY